MKFVRIKQCKFKKCLQREAKAYYFNKNGYVVKETGVFPKPRKILDCRQNVNYSTKSKYYNNSNKLVADKR